MDPTLTYALVSVVSMAGGWLVRHFLGSSSAPAPAAPQPPASQPMAPSTSGTSSLQPILSSIVSRLEALEQSKLSSNPVLEQLAVSMTETLSQLAKSSLTTTPVPAPATPAAAK